MQNGDRQSEATMTHTRPPELLALRPAALIRPSDETPTVQPNYNMFSESVRTVTPNELQCSMFCGGKRCKYESGREWSESEMAVDGIYSHWITDDILAMARPNTKTIREKSTIEHFRRLGIRSLVNLQLPGEHSHCGTIEQSGFTYDPNIFMTNDVFFYNFGWKDYGEPSLAGILDITKVLAFALTQGKVAIHCHAGLGRTGVIIACYLVYWLRVKANDAIRYVRLKRPNAVQTRGQILAVQEFEQFILPQLVVFSNKELVKDRDKKKEHPEFTLAQCLSRQRHVLHGYEARVLRHIPKLVYVLCERLVRLCEPVSRSRSGGLFSAAPDYRVGSPSFTAFFIAARLQGETASTLSYSQMSTMPVTSPSDSPVPHGSDSLNGSRLGSTVDDTSLDSVLDDGIHNQSLAQNDVYHEMMSQVDLRKAAEDEQIQRVPVTAIYDALLVDHALLGPEFNKRIKSFRLELNIRQSAWEKLGTETDLKVLTGLLFTWLEHLKTPILDKEYLTYIVLAPGKIDYCFTKQDKDTRFTVEYLVRFISRLQPLTPDQQKSLLLRVAAALTQQGVPVEGTLKPAGKGYSKMREGTLRKLTEFMETLLELVSLETARPGTHVPARSLDDEPSAHGKHSSLARATLTHSHSEETAASRRMRPLHTPHSSASSSSHSPSPTADDSLQEQPPRASSSGNDP
ncbi:protein tyrosine phosphatase domain-containing protein 1-like [Amphibalanus amphitrite]|uniref:protein tyrosine phosphatase domain-containing protein 1-like n=1 Tax=Amphibalanus amphitrite TaxID=1232801 RepID=UPI001C90CACC|nr:protein tyrosine phosphatase domain-containing protein 1-like [Amphibalanus amphitrite]XP_043192114.1 protein tyrosine phosphatase domain-containing protein 1-like [Amphibalanus amphitrite]